VVVVVSLVITFLFPVVISGPPVNSTLQNGDVITQKELEARVRRANEAGKALMEVATPEHLIRLEVKRLGVLLLFLSACAVAFIGALGMIVRKMHLPIAVVPTLLVAGMGVVLVYL
jgi:hypothetical protein